MSSPSFETQTKPKPNLARYPRRTRLGGFLISPETATAWASRLSGRKLHVVYDSPSVWKVLCERLRPYRASFGGVGEELGVKCMVITQSARFNGYKDMDPSLIPQFEEGEREAIARELLEEEGIKDYEFGTVLD